MTKALTHVALHVKDVFASRDFYQNQAGMRVISERADANGGQPVMWLASPGYEDMFVVVLIPGGLCRDEPENRGDIGHLGVSVASRRDVEDVADYGRKNGVLYREFRKRASLQDDMCMVKDPDGNVVEFTFNAPRTEKVLTHIALHVDDVSLCRDFYEGAGMSVTRQYETPRTPGQPVTWLSSRGYEQSFALVLIPGGKKTDRPGNRGDLGHLGFSVDTEEELRSIEELARRKGNLHWGYQEHDYPVGKICAALDPHRNVVEYSLGQPLGPDFVKRKKEEKEQPCLNC